MFSTFLLVSKSSSPFTNSLLIILRILTGIRITVTFIFPGLSRSLARSRYLSLFSLSFIFTLRFSGTANPQFGDVLSFFFCWLSLGLVIWQRLGDPLVSPNLREGFVSHLQNELISNTLNYLRMQYLKLFNNGQSNSANGLFKNKVT